MTPSIHRQRFFPTHDFVVRTPLVRDEVIARLLAAMEEPSTTSWPMPSPHLTGRVDGGTFRCRPRTSAFGGNAAASVRGEIVPRADGGTDVVVRVIDWFPFVLATPFIVAGLWFAVNAASTAELWKSLAMAGWLTLVALGVHAVEGAFVRRIFKRLFSAP